MLLTKGATPYNLYTCSELKSQISCFGSFFSVGGQNKPRILNFLRTSVHKRTRPKSTHLCSGDRQTVVICYITYWLPSWDHDDALLGRRWLEVYNAFNTGTIHVRLRRDSIS